ncbi:hypothetical protein SAMN06295955_111143 [Sphingopyxis indica]|uniref:Uncharacterized protein n=2 Tax=Sphingopyxis indica TaxID=436663 RepID=A0A239K151_9SPHN|nr:hypothetical protein SAMN06295955_111143 [Sphingopyxis indica]
MLRAYYALMAAGSLAVFWPHLVSHSPEWGIESGAQYALLGALAPLSMAGLRYPLKMMPLILYEFLWKALWFVFVAAPLYVEGQMTDGVLSNIFACGIAIVLTPIVMPWRYFWHTYIVARAEPWGIRQIEQGVAASEANG